MPEVYSKFISFLVLIFVAIVAPLMLVSIKMEKTVENIVNSKAQKFVSECQVTGYIDPGELQRFYSSVQGLGRYDISLTYSSKTAYPDDGKYKDVYVDYNMQNITSVMYPETGEDQEFIMKNGDRLSIKIKGHAFDAAAGYSSLIFGTDIDQIISQHTETIGNNRQL